MTHGRPPHRDEALSLALAAEARRADARAVVLADLDGFLVAGAGASVDHHQLAAFAALAHDPRAHGDRLRGATTGPLRVVPVRVRGAALLCASVGGGAPDVVAVEAAARAALEA